MFIVLLWLLNFFGMFNLFFMSIRLTTEVKAEDFDS